MTAQNLSATQPPANLKPMFTLGNHEAITRAVGRCYVNAGYLTSDELDDIVFHNLETDFIGFFRSWYHYDNCCFSRGSARIRELYDRIARIGNRHRHGSLECFGGILHTVQDFYSHSNWVEHYDTQATMPIWDLDPTHLQSGTVSGYVWWEPKDCSTGPIPSHHDLNKDSSTSKKGMTKVGGAGPNKDRTYFQLALEAATSATLAEFVKFVGVVVPPCFTMAELEAQISRDGSSGSVVDSVQKILEAHAAEHGQKLMTAPAP